VDSTVTIEGSGFTDGDADISATFGGESLTLEAETTAVVDGEFDIDFDVPSDATGGGKEVGVDVGGETATSSFTVGTPTIALDPAEGPQGDTVEVTGSGFATEKEDYALRFDETKQKTVETDTDGEFTTSTSWSSPVSPSSTLGTSKDIVNSPSVSVSTVSCLVSSNRRS